MEIENKKKLQVKLVLYAVLFIPSLFIAYVVSWPMLPNFRFGPDLRISSKIINPDEQGFSPDDFRFDDYNSYNDLAHVLGNIFSKGHSKDEVLKKFKGGYGGLLYKSIEEHNNEALKSVEKNGYAFEEDIIVSYPRLYPLQSCFWAPNNKTDKIIFSFNKNGQLKSLIIKYSCTLYVVRTYWTDGLIN